MQPLSGLFFAVLNAESAEVRVEAVRQWAEAAWRGLVQVWNTVADERVRQQVAVWRYLLGEAVWRK